MPLGSLRAAAETMNAASMTTDGVDGMAMGLFGTRGSRIAGTSFTAEQAAEKAAPDPAAPDPAAATPKTIEFTTRAGKTVMLNNESKSACIDSCKSAPELKDGNGGGLDAVLGAATGGEKQNIADCVNFCGVEHEMWCFPGDATVVVEQRGRVPLSQLQLGDKVLALDAVASSKGEPGVYYDTALAWLHRDPEAEAEVLEIHHELGKLQLTPNHLVYVRSAASSSAGMPALPTISREVSVGDRLLTRWLDGTLASPKVTAVERVWKRGLYAPLLAGGNLLVDGTAASCYAIPRHVSNSAVFKLMGQCYHDGAAFHAAAHALFLPLRLLSAPMLSAPGPQQQWRGVAICNTEKEKKDASQSLGLRSKGDEAVIAAEEVNGSGMHPYAYACYVTLASFVA